jgi:hypothetical protein
MKSKLFLMCLAGGLTMTSLVKADPAVVVTPGHTTVTTGVWTTVPDDYDGDYYLYNKRYYYGGKHEVGDFKWEGRSYKDRYMHDGKWIYGGDWEHHTRKHIEHEREHKRD